MKKTLEELLDSRIVRFTQDMKKIAIDRKEEKLKMKPTTIFFEPACDDTEELPIGMHISLDPRRLEPGDGDRGGDGTFFVRIYMTENAYAALILQLSKWAIGIGDEGDGTEYPSIVIDGEMY